jgi:Delta14-sterol reductase
VGWPKEGVLGLASWKATGWVLGYYLVNLFLYRFLPAIETEGTVLVTGGRLPYRFNCELHNYPTSYTLRHACGSLLTRLEALSTGLTILAALLAGTVAQGADFPVWTFLDENYLQILTAFMIISYGLAIFVYVRSFSVKQGNKECRELAAGGHSGNMLYDWYIGRELNPRITLPIFGEIDIKEWCEVRPGLLLWAVLNFSFVAKQYRNFGYVTDGIVFISFAQLLYIVDCWWNEPAILTTIDITTDGFGFMLSFGDMVWVPFIYSTQARYLATHPQSLGASGLVIIFTLIGIGYYIFRASNSQKNTFRTNPEDPSVAHLQYIETKTGSRLLITGWWGMARHINYFGDWIQSWPYSLPTGMAGYTILAAGSNASGAHKLADGREVIPGAARGWAILFTYFYIIYFAILLIHRDRRDDEKCHRKYGADWEKYKKVVKWRIVPGIY